MRVVIRRAPQDFFWMAGLLEGECSFGYTEKRGPWIELEMTDEDVVQRVARLWHRAVTPRKSRNPRWKPTFRTSVRGRDAIAWMMTILPHMGQRRRARIKGILEQWKAH